jgi:hypothetical protein
VCTVGKHIHAIRAVLSCFDRVLLRGCVPLMGGYATAESLKHKQYCAAPDARGAKRCCGQASGLVHHQPVGDRLHPGKNVASLFMAIPS